MGSFANSKNIYRFIILTLILVLCISLFLPFLTTLAVAAIFAMVLNPFIARIQKFSFRGFSIKCQKKCAALLLAVVLVVFTVPFGMMVNTVYENFKEFSLSDTGKQEFVVKFSSYIAKSEKEISMFISKLGFKRNIKIDDISVGISEKIANVAFNYATEFVTHIPEMVIDFLIFLGALFFFLAESMRIEKFFYSIGLFSRIEVSIVEASLRASSYSTVISTFLAGLVHGLIVALGATLVGVGDFSFIFIATFLLSFIPVIGATLMALGLCIPALIQQNYSGTLVLLGIALLASAVDNLIRPLFLTYGNKFVHPFISLLSVLGGIAIFGMAGLFIGPVVVQVAFETFPKLMHIVPQLKSGPPPEWVLSNEFETLVQHRE